MSGAEEDNQRMDADDGKKVKLSEGATVLQLQMEAIDKLKVLKTRRFKRVKMSVATVGGSKLWVWTWASDMQALNKIKQNKAKTAQSTCDICGRSFLDNRRLAIHKNVHLKGLPKAPV